LENAFRHGRPTDIAEADEENRDLVRHGVESDWHAKTVREMKQWDQYAPSSLPEPNENADSDLYYCNQQREDHDRKMDDRRLGERG
jgi:hypothetical protein